MQACRIVALHRFNRFDLLSEDVIENYKLFLSGIH